MNSKDIQTLNQAKANQKDNKNYLYLLRNANLDHVFSIIKEIHRDEFSTTDCLSCANCCKTTPPLITPQDIKRIAKHLVMSESVFKKFYVINDYNGEMMLQRIPCIFLDQNNKCTIYDVRPEACKRYPHTDEKAYTKRITLNLANTTICPAAARILDKLKIALPLDV